MANKAIQEWMINAAKEKRNDKLRTYQKRNEKKTYVALLLFFILFLYTFSLIENVYTH